MKLSLQYRGPLTSCNYACSYCPFAKRQESKTRLQADHDAIARFTDWISDHDEHTFRVLFTPWGEALVRSWYRDAVCTLSHLPNIDSVCIQTNLSCRLDWVRNCNSSRFSIWATYHPTEVSMERFIAKVKLLDDCGVRLSVGMVAVPEFFPTIQKLREELPGKIYLWLNAQQPRRRQYTRLETDALTSIDPQFPLTLTRQRSLDRDCPTGHTSFTIDGVGNMRRCHFVDDVIGNIYQPEWTQSLKAVKCPKKYCSCYLGISQLQADEHDFQPQGPLPTRIPS